MFLLWIVANNYELEYEIEEEDEQVATATERSSVWRSASNGNNSRITSSSGKATAGARKGGR